MCNKVQKKRKSSLFLTTINYERKAAFPVLSQRIEHLVFYITTKIVLNVFERWYIALFKIKKKKKRINKKTQQIYEKTKVYFEFYFKEI